MFALARSHLFNIWLMSLIKCHQITPRIKETYCFLPWHSDEWADKTDIKHVCQLRGCYQISRSFGEEADCKVKWLRRSMFHQLYSEEIRALSPGTVWRRMNLETSQESWIVKPVPEANRTCAETIWWRHLCLIHFLQSKSRRCLTWKKSSVSTENHSGESRNCPDETTCSAFPDCDTTNLPGPAASHQIRRKRRPTRTKNTVTPA